MCSYWAVYRFLKTNTFFFAYFHKLFLNQYLFFPCSYLASMLLTNISPCDLLSWCLCRGGVWFLLENSYHIQSLCPDGQGKEGVSQMQTDVDKEEGRVKNHWNCADILYGWPHVWKLTVWYSNVLLRENMQLS